jgi:hypothetical protein
VTTSVQQQPLVMAGKDSHHLQMLMRAQTAVVVCHAVLGSVKRSQVYAGMSNTMIMMRLVTAQQLGRHIVRAQFPL